MRHATIAAIPLFALAVTADPASAASFDCAKASTAIETTICGDAELSRLDEALGAAYAAARTASDQPKVLRSRQRAWLRDVRDACTDAACLKAAYAARVAELEALSATPDPAAEPRKLLRITNITPGGTNVPGARQVVFQFNRPVVPIGRMDRPSDEIPIEISPSLECQWRWLNTSALACQLGEGQELRLATDYSIVVRPGIRAEDGATIDGEHRHEFSTQRPRVRYARFSTWRSPGFPVIQVTFTQPVTRASVAEHLFLALGGSSPGRRDLVVEPDPNLRQQSRFFLTPDHETIVDFGEAREQGVDDAPGMLDGNEVRRVWLVKPVEELPLETQVDLSIEPGLVSAAGPKRGDEARTVVRFHTFPEFRFIGVACSSNARQRVLVTPGNAATAAKCNPNSGVSLVFSAPVINTEVKDHVAFVPELSGGLKDYDPWANRRPHSRLNQPHRPNRNYHVALPTALKAFAEYRIAAHDVASGPKDEFGRSLPEPIDLTFFTDHRLPGYRLTHSTAVLEDGVDSQVPLYVTNIEDATIRYRRVTRNDDDFGLDHSLQLADVLDVQYGVPLGIREMLGGETGLVYGLLSTIPSLSPRPTRFLAAVTPWQIHVKAGHFNSVVWVTDLATGAPVEGARVLIYKQVISAISNDFNILEEAVTDASGTAAFSGFKKLDPGLTTFRGSCANIGPDGCLRLMVRIEKGEDIAVLPLDRRFEAHAYRVSNNTVWTQSQRKYGHVRSWGTTAQGVYRVGDTIEYKIYVRDKSNESLVPAPKGSYTLELVDPTGKVVHTEKDITLSGFGGYDGSYAVPESGAVGWYQFRLAAGYTRQTWTPMRVLVADFTPSSFGVAVGLNGDLFQSGDEVVVDSRATLFSGGPYTDAETRVTATLRGRGFVSRHPQTASFRFDTYNRKSSQVLLSKTGQLGDDGTISESFRITDEMAQQIVYGSIEVEGAVRDDRGKYVAASARAIYVGIDRLVGLKSPRWLYKANEPAEIPYVVVDARGAPAPGTPVVVAIERLETKAARVKGAGNAYLTQFVNEWVSAGRCEGVSADAPLSCDFVPDTPGTYRLTASITDTNGRPHKTELRIWVTGPGRVVWQQPNDDRLEIIPEKTSYEVGETARYLVKNPYPGARALVTVERYGVLKRWMQTLESGTPVIEFPVEKDYLPGFYLSVVVMSPRVAAPLPKLGEVDLGKPTFRMGYVRVPVADPYKMLDVTVETPAEVYRPRDVVRASIHVEPRHKDRDEPIEVAVAVLDEAVLDLIQGGTGYYDPYRGFYRLEALDLRNFSLLTRLVGRQKIEKKGANQGGDGAAARLAMAASGEPVNARSLFKYLSYWNPSLELDRNGNAEIEFEVPDNLTGWRVLVLATTPTDRLGLGEGGFRVNRPTEIRPVMPNQVTEGDTFEAGFSVMNRTGEAREIAVSIEAEGVLKAPVSHQEIVSLQPYKRSTVYVPLAAGRVAVDRNVPVGEIRFEVRAGDTSDADAIKVSLPVNKRRSLDVGANYGMIVTPLARESLQFPPDIIPDVGTVDVVLSPSVIGNVEGAFRYLRDYPYICWEQKLTKAVMASHYRNLKSYLPDDLLWPAAEGLPQRTLKQAANYQAPNGGMGYFSPSNMYVSPYLSAYTALAFNWLRDSGYEVPEDVEQRLHNYLETLVRRDTMPSFYSRGMSSTVRAVALAALSRHGKVNLSDLQRYRSHVDYMSLFGKAHFLQAATNVTGGGETVRDVMEIILQSSFQSGGKFSFNEELDDSYARILATPIRANCAILSSLTQAGASAISRDQLGDIPFKLVRSLTQTRGARTHWENTQENVFCMNAMIDYSRVFEDVPPDMRVAVAVDDRSMGDTAFSDLRDAPVTLSRPIGPDDPGVRRNLSIRRDGDGRLYYAARMSFALKDENSLRVNAGIDIRKEYSVERNGEWVLLGNPANIAQGELVRVDIYLSLPTARNFLVVDDPVPGGLEPLNRDLANTSTVDADKGRYKASGGAWWFQYSDWRSYGVSRWSFHYTELRHDAVRFYSDYLSAGNYHLSYAAQAISGGTFVRMPVHAEEMYDPDVYGKGLPGRLVVDRR